MSKTRPPAERFIARVCAAPDLWSCWIWSGSTASGGYGRIFIRNGLVVRAHRFAYELWRGPIPTGLVIDHLCRTRNCVNPLHMETVTHVENTMRGFSPMAENKRLVTCLYGHPLSGDNLRVDKDDRGRPRRRCRSCAARREREREVSQAERERRRAYFREYNRTRRRVA